MKCFSWTAAGRELVERARQMSRRGNYVGMAGLEQQLQSIANSPGKDPAADAVYLFCLATLSEQSDQRGHYDESQSFLSLNQEEVLQKLHDAEVNPNSELAEARGMYILRCAVAQHRGGHHDKAKDLVSRTLHVLTRLKSAGPRDISLFHYWLARFSIQLHRYSDAREHSYAAMELISRHLDEHLKGCSRKSPQSNSAAGAQPQLQACCSDEIQLAQYRMGSVLAFTMSQVMESTGRIQDALYFLLPALTLLAPTVDDNYRMGIARLQLGSLQRIRGEGDPQKLAEAKGALRDALTSFLPNDPQHEHRLYEAHVYQEMADLDVAHFEASRSTGEDGTLLKNARDSIDAARRKGIPNQRLGYKDIPLDSAIDLVEARVALYEGNQESAVGLATQVIGRARDRQDKSSLAEGLLLRGQAYLFATEVKSTQAMRNVEETKALELAENDFREARECGSSHPRLVALANVYLADAALRGRKMEDAYRSFQAYKQIQPPVESPALQRLAKRVEQRFEEAGVLVFDLVAQPMSFREMQEQLRAYCVTQAKWQGGKDVSPDEAARLLGVSRATFFGMQKKAITQKRKKKKPDSHPIR